MERELSRDIFSPEKKSLEPNLKPNQTGKMFESQILSIRKELLQSQKEISQMKTQLMEFKTSTQISIKKMESQMRDLTNSVATFQKNVAIRLSNYNSQFVQRKSIDHKIQSFMDNQTQLIQSFENKISKLTREIQKRENQAIKLEAALNEAKMELAQFKK